MRSLITDLNNTIKATLSLPRSERLFILGKGLALSGIIAFLFFDSAFGMLVGLLFLYPYFKNELTRYHDSVLEKTEQRFKEMLLSLVAAMKAGYSVENAFAEVYKDLRFRFGEKDETVMRLVIILRQLKNHIPIENLMEEMASETGSEDISDFADVFRIAKRTGGNMTAIMEHSVSIIARRMEMKEAIAMAVASKKYEQQIMNVVPMGIILYIRLSNPGYLNSLYHNPAGVLIMSAALCIYGVAYLLSRKILRAALV